MTEIHNMIKISSTNCRGLGDSGKRRDVFNYLREKNFGIYCLQDTHFTEALEPYIRAEWGGEITFNSYISNSRGVCILFSNSLEYKVHKSKADENGNLLVLDIEIENKRLILVHGPNQDSPDFFLNIQEIIEEFENETIIIYGDFNLVQNQDLDTCNYTNINNPNAKEKVLHLKEEMNLMDPFRGLYEISKQYRWRKRNPLKQARLDFFLVSEALMSSIDDINIISSYRSDHSSVVLSLILNEFKKGNGIWKFNSSLLKDKMLVEEKQNKCIHKVK